MNNLLRSDFLRYRESYSRFRFLKLFFVHPGFKCVCYLRLQQYFAQSLSIKIANQLRFIILKKFGLDSVTGNQIGPGLRIEHPVGIVIGYSVRVGDNLTVMQNSTLGERFVDDRSDGKGPIIGNNVIIGANVQILGNIVISDNSVILGNSVVLRGTIPGERVSGVCK